MEPISKSSQTKLSHAREHEFGVQSTQFIYRSGKWIRNKMPVHIWTFTRIESRRKSVTALAQHRPQVCAVDEHVPFFDQLSCALGDYMLCCNLPVVLCVTACFFFESKKGQVREPLERTNQELIVEVSAIRRIKKHSRCWLIHQSETGLRCSWKKHCAILPIIYQTCEDNTSKRPVFAM